MHCLPPTISNAVWEVHDNVQAPIPLIFASAMSVISLAVQDMCDVLRIDGLEGPTSLFFLTVAESGERKTTVDKIFTKPIRDYEATQAAANISLLEQHRIEKAKREITKKALEISIQKRLSKGESTSEQELTIEKLISEDKPEPRPPKLLFGNSSPEALTNSLFKNSKSAAIISAEGAVVFGSRTLKNEGMINDTWSGAPTIVDRVSSDSYTLNDARLTISIMAPLKVLQDHYKKIGSQSRENGSLSRYLVATCPSTQGTRFLYNRTYFWNRTEVFQNRISAILQGKSATGRSEAEGGEREMIEPTPDGLRAWIEYHNRVESELRAGGFLEDIRDHGSKLPEIAARLAALFHYFEGCEGKISADMINRATQICDWYLFEFKNLFGSKPTVPLEVQDANDLEMWLREFCHRNPGTSYVDRNFISQYGPNKLRSKSRRDFALTVLWNHQKVGFHVRGKVKVVLLNPAWFPSVHYVHQSALSC